MMKTSMIVLGLLVFSQPVLAEAQSKATFPLMQLECQTVTATAGSSFDAKSARVMLPVKYHLTNSDKRLKFYNSLLAFEGGHEAYVLAQPKITQRDMDNKSGRFGDIKARQADDDIPTAFSIDETVYELQTVTGFPIKEVIGEKSFRIDTSAVIRVKLEKVTDSGKRETPVWQGDCVFNNVTSQS